MANKVLLKKSSVAAKVPLTTDLDYGELALNYSDEKIYFKNASNAIKSFTAVDWTKRSVRVATTANITLSGTQTIDGVAVVAGDRVLVKDQTTASQNGIYVVAAGAWTRAAGADTAAEMAGAVVSVDSGTANGGLHFDTDFKSTDTLGTTANNWYKVYDTNDAATANTANKLVLRDGSGNFSAGTITAALTGNASTATTLQTARTINGTSFNGSANITTSSWGTSRSLTIGSTAKSVDGSANVSWSLAEIGAAAATHDHAGLLHRNTFVVDADAAITEGTYGFGAGSGLLNFPWVSGYGKLIVTVNTGGTYNGTSDWIWQVINDTSGRRYSRYRINAGAWTSWVLESTAGLWNGNSSTATTLQTARNINGVSFNGSADITIADSTKLPLSGGTLTGGLSVPSLTVSGTSGIEGGEITIAKPASDTILTGNVALDVYASTVRFFAGTSGGTKVFDLDFTQASGKIVTSANYNNYAPQLNGTGATGTWGIGITGNAGTVTNGVYTNNAQTITGVKTFSNGIIPGNTQGYPDYSALIDFNNDVANTWRKIVSASLADVQYSTIGFKIDVVDPVANHATTSSVNSVRTETYYVACVRTESTVTNTPDACYVTGPSDRIRAVKTSTGNYEIQIQNAAQYREYRVEISAYAVNGGHTISYFPGDTASAGTAQYASTVSTTATDFFQNVSARSFTSTGNITAGGSLTVSGTTQTAGHFYAGTTAPTGTTRLNYSGYFYPTFINLAASGDTATAATHYFVETGSDGFVRPKTLANVRTEIVTSAAVIAGLGFTPSAAGGQFFGSATTKAIAYNSNTIAENVTVTAGNNGLSAGPITISNGFTVTVESGANWVIV